MTLSPEERARIYEEEKARLHAQDAIKQGQARAQAKIEQDRRNAEQIFVAIGTIVLITLLLVLAVRQNNSTERADILMPGSIVILDLNGTGALMGTSPEACDLRDKYVNALDMDGLQALVDAGMVREISSGTRARVLSIQALQFSYEVRILDGQYAGESGYVPKEACTLCRE